MEHRAWGMEQIQNPSPYALCSMLYATLDTLGIFINEIPPRSHTWPLLPH